MGFQGLYFYLHGRERWGDSEVDTLVWGAVCAREGGTAHNRSSPKVQDADLQVTRSSFKRLFGMGVVQVVQFLRKLCLPLDPAFVHCSPLVLCLVPAA
jgi:hypothetical protein